MGKAFIFCSGDGSYITTLVCLYILSIFLFLQGDRYVRLLLTGVGENDGISRGRVDGAGML